MKERVASRSAKYLGGNMQRFYCFPPKVLSVCSAVRSLSPGADCLCMLHLLSESSLKGHQPHIHYNARQGTAVPEVQCSFSMKSLEKNESNV